MKKIILIFIFLRVIVAHSQSKDTIITCNIKCSPLKHSYIKIIKASRGSYNDPSDIVNLFSRTNNVYSVHNGTIVKKGIDFVIIKSKDIFISYSNLNYIYCNQGDLVKEKQLVATCKRDGSNTYLLEILIATVDGSLTRDESLKYLKEN